MLLASLPALACGGFFCDNAQPVIQSAERLLFRVEPGGDVTTFVEIQFEGPPSAFGWVLPVPAAFDPTVDVSVAPAGVFDGLEAQTAPRFGAGLEVAMGSACGCGPMGEAVPPDTSGVEVVGEAVVGPFAIELISAEEGDNLTNWLLLNGYQVPTTAAEPMQHYIDAGMYFLGFKLDSDVGSGPIDTIVLSCAQAAPSIPLLLTAIAAADDMEILAYVLADEPYMPEGYASLDFDWASVSSTEDYVVAARDAIDAAGGRAFVTEFSGEAYPVMTALDAELAASLGEGTWLTRMRTWMDADEMTADPTFVPGGEPVDQTGTGDTGTAWFLGGLLLGAGLRRRRG